MTGDHHPADDLRPYEPVRFEIGQRVRIRLSPECPLPKRPRTAGGVVEHYREQDGLEGTVASVANRAHPNGHPYLVYLPQTCQPNTVICCGVGYFAAAELEPLDEGANE